MNRVIYICFMAMTLVTLSGVESVATAQYHKERGMVRDGNKQFDQRNYRRSLNNYNNALVEDSTNYEALYNRANAYYHLAIKGGQDSEYSLDQSNIYYERLAADTLLSDSRRAEAYRNLGESLFAQQNYEAALNSLRESLKLNPNDKETKYDYVLTKRIVDQKRQAEQNQEQNQDQNNDQNQNNDNQSDQNNSGDNNDTNENKDNNENKENQDNKGNNEKQDNDKNNNNNKQDNKEDGDQSKDDKNKDGQPEESESESKPQPRELNPDQRRMLDAIQAQEDKTQEKMKEEAKGIIVQGKKNW